MNDKIKRLSSNLSEIIPDHDTIQDLYFELRNLMVKQKDYFSNISPENMVKVLFYIWSIKKTGNFNLGDKLLNNILFAILITTEGNHHREECPSCDGAGEQYCNYCDGNGNVECDNCDGDGVITCSECDGDGRQMGDGKWENCDECGGSGEIKCEECGGGGEVSCNECGGSGREDCNTCDGGGIIETDENLYRVETFISWNPELKSISELKYEDNSPIGDEEFSRLTSKNSFLISQDDSEGELRDFVSTEDQYVYYYSDEGEELIFSSSGNVLNSDDPTSYLID
jgi:hypothetical protein